MYKKIRNSVVYTCMVVSFLQLGGCSSHRAGIGNTGKIALNPSDKDSASEHAIGDDETFGDDKLLFGKEVRRLSRSLWVNGALSVTLWASLGCFWWWCSLPQASDNTRIIVGIYDVTEMLDNLKNRMVHIENARNITTPYFSMLESIGKRISIMRLLIAAHNHTYSVLN